MKINCAHDELLELHKIVANPKNPNKHSDAQIERLAKLIDFHGQRHPIIISKRSGFVVAGHGRLEAIKKLGWERAAVNFQDFDSEAVEYSFVVSDNAIAEWSQLDQILIKSELLTLDLPELDLLGFESFITLPEDDVMPDYGVLDGEDDDFSKGVKKSVQIEFELGDYEGAIQEIKYWREQGLYIGEFLIKKLKEQRDA